MLLSSASSALARRHVAVASLASRSSAPFFANMMLSTPTSFSAAAGGGAKRSMSASTIYKFDVSPETLKIVQATLPAVAEAGTDFTKHFYRRMFAANPSLKNVFNQTNQALGGQPKKLLKTVAIAAQAAIETGELPGSAIESICQKHCALNVGEADYNVVAVNLLGTIEDLLTKDQAVLDAWAELYGGIAGAFVTREGEISAEVSSQPGSWSGRRKFVLAEKETISSVIKRFKFVPADGEPTPQFEPGKFTTIWVPTDEEDGPYGSYTEQPRHYTLNLPQKAEDSGHCMEISVKKQGLVSRILHKADVGSEWELSAPHGCFTMSGVEKLWLNNVDAPVVFLSAGVGITPGTVLSLCSVSKFASPSFPKFEVLLLLFSLSPNDYC